MYVTISAILFCKTSVKFSREDSFYRKKLEYISYLDTTLVNIHVKPYGWFLNFELVIWKWNRIDSNQLILRFNKISIQSHQIYLSIDTLITNLLYIIKDATVYTKTNSEKMFRTQMWCQINCMLLIIFWTIVEMSFLQNVEC